MESMHIHGKKFGNRILLSSERRYILRQICAIFLEVFRRMFGELIPRLKDSSLNQACQELNMVMRSPRVNGNKPGDRIFCLFWVVVGFIFLGNICEISAVNFKGTLGA